METENKIWDVLKELTEFLELWNDELHPLAVDDGESLISKAKTILAAPPRNCDVGTAEEQEVRFTEFCDAHKYVGDDGANVCSSDCPFYNKIDCGVWWAQMPYNERGAK